MKLKTIKQQLNQLIAHHEGGESPDLALIEKLKSALKDKKASCKHKLRHGVDFAKWQRAEKKLKKIKSHLKSIDKLEEELKESSQ